MGRACQALSLDEVVILNRRAIARSGGLAFIEPDNTCNRGTLEHVLVQISGAVFGHDRFPTVIDKAAALGWRIIAGHVFNDGNKRTGMAACRLLLEMNGFEMHIDRQVIGVAIDVADGRVGVGEFTQWLTDRTSTVD